MKPLTEKQANIYAFIVASLRDKGYPPSQEEIRDHFKFASLNAVRSHLALIAKKGYVHLSAGKARGIQVAKSIVTEIPPEGDDTIPLLGRIAAGVPIWAEQSIESLLPISPTLFGGGKLFALHVIGDSMVQIGIMNGDVAVIRRQNSVENGEIGAVLIGQEATLKRVYLSSGSLVLKSENPEYEDLVYDETDVESPCVIGRYQGVLRIDGNRRCL